MIKKLAIMGLLAITPYTAFADAIVFGNLKMGITTEAELQQLYGVSNTGTSSWTQGNIYKLDDTSTIPLGGLQNVTFIFTTDRKLSCVNMTIDKSRFKDMHAGLKKKYKVTKSVIPFVGDTFVRYVDGKTTIELDAPHLSFEMNLSYMQKEFKDAYEKGLKQQEQQKKQTEENLL